MANGDEYCTQDQARSSSSQMPAAVGAYNIYNATSFNEFFIYNNDDMVNDMLAFLDDTPKELPLLQ